MLKRGHHIHTSQKIYEAVFRYVSVQLLGELPDVLLQLGRVHLFFFKAVKVQGHQLKNTTIKAKTKKTQ